ncbi:MAG: tRNA threonylcarbamoyladenosine dehydratase [Bacilli bacterium]|nr:tRNA threonylcarbamoyladenosine dehydratase [Bacilli bacterium]
MFERLKLQIKDSNLDKIKNTTVLVIGLGGVGSYAVESLTRSGISRLIIIDNDKIDITNLNRQLMTFHSNIGMNKTDVWESRIKDINPDCEVIKITDFITKDNIDIISNYKIDYIVDACDTIETKKELIRYAIKNNIKIISSMGTGNKLDPSKLKIMDIKKTSYDPIAKILRKMVRDERIKVKIPVICSSETSIKTNGKTISSNSFVPATAGLLITSYIINDIIDKEIIYE